MMWYLTVALIVIIAALWLQLLSRKTRQPTPISRSRDEGKEVRCVTCGIWVAREKALEKKGRYFCGVKKSEREVGAASATNNEHRFAAEAAPTVAPVRPLGLRPGDRGIEDHS